MKVYLLTMLVVGIFLTVLTLQPLPDLMYPRDDIVIVGGLVLVTIPFAAAEIGSRIQNHFSRRPDDKQRTKKREAA